MLFDDTYRTIDGPVTGEFRDRGSKFLAFAYPIRTEEDAKIHLQTLRGEHPRANHHCFAWRLGLDRNHYRISDDGEPSGTAGRPILNTLYSREITNVLVVVVRYFGGTLLGVPGLINAYKLATVEALENAVIVSKTVNESYRIDVGFERLNDVMRLIKEQQLTVLNQSFESECRIDIELRRTLVNAVIGRLEKMEGVRVTFLG
ncbi:IMPACT family protein [Tellurirhabdus rosea]|uniref:IMPACT family protein n=1 Tax=Tellurirhabdus rosea TaxID=2674997 RepID=UPI00225334AE|nr:YigZ family protein [Tellurirhabdus rosea]